jgi:Secretion system C-terminal sorting domain
MARSNVLAFSVPQDNNYTVSIYSAQGKLSAATSKFCTKDGQNQIALKDFSLSPGLYLVKIAKADYSAMGKILVK